MNIQKLWLTNFRNYVEAEAHFAPDALTAITGENGEGKSNLLEAVGFITTRRSFRGAANESLVRVGAETAVLRAEATQADGRELLVEMEIPPTGRVRMQVNKQNIVRIRDLADYFAVVVFAPDDLVLVKGGPAERREWLDTLMRFRGAKYGEYVESVEQVLKQRNALLRNAEGYLNKSNAETLNVLDDQFATASELLVKERRRLLDDLEPHLTKAYQSMVEKPSPIHVEYEPSWTNDLLSSLLSVRDHDVRRGTSTIGPHRDDVSFLIREMPARTHASQGEQRSLVLAARLAAHGWLTEVRKEAPLLMLDDVFSELDAFRRQALIKNLPETQTLLTSASDIPEEIHPAQTMRVDSGNLDPE